MKNKSDVITKNVPPKRYLRADGTPLFAEKLALINEALKKTGLPKKP
jgi:hypothetical protein